MTEDNTKKAEDKPVKQTRKRVRLGSRNVLTASQRPGFKRRFVNDTKDRIQEFKEAGYSIVEEKLQVGDPKIGRPNQLGSSVSSQGDGQRKVLMEIPEEYYHEDYQAEQAKITQKENEIRRTMDKPGADGLVGQVNIS